MIVMFDRNRLKRDFTDENLQAWAEFLAEVNRANFYFKREGWSQGTLWDWDPEKKECTMQLRWGDDQNDHEQYCHYEDMDEEEYHRQFDEYQLSVKLTDFVS